MFKRDPDYLEQFEREQEAIDQMIEQGGEISQAEVTQKTTVTSKMSQIDKQITTYQQKIDDKQIKIDAMKRELEKLQGDIAPDVEKIAKLQMQKSNMSKQLSSVERRMQT